MPGPTLAGLMAETTTTPRRPGRPLYTDEQKRIVLEQYQYCHTRSEKAALAERLGMSMEQLYNLANRLKATRTYQERAAQNGLAGQAAFAPARLLEREDPATAVFTADQDAYLSRHFGYDARGRKHLEEISFHLGHTETAVAWRARHLGLRRFCKYWDAAKVTAWLGQEEAVLRRWGVDFFPCLDRQSELAITLVSSSSLLRMLEEPGREQELVDAGADRFFLLELSELAASLRRGDALWEVSRWISHGQTHLNPWGGVSFGLFDDGSDDAIPGRELHPSDLRDLDGLYL